LSPRYGGRSSFGRESSWTISFFIFFQANPSTSAVGHFLSDFPLVLHLSPQLNFLSVSGDVSSFQEKDKGLSL